MSALFRDPCFYSVLALSSIGASSFRLLCAMMYRGRNLFLKLYCTLAGAVDGFFMADTGLTCCEFAGTSGKPMTVVAGSESGVVHFLELPM